MHRKTARAKQRLQRRLHLEPLERRHLLATIVVTEHQDVVNLNDSRISLREAITMANAEPGHDEILLNGTYLLSIPGTEEDNNATGDLDILDDVTIRDISIAGRAHVSWIGANDRVLDIHDDANVTLDSISLSQGKSDRGAGIAHRSSGVLNLRSVELDGNSATESGGGLFVSEGGTVLIRESTIAGNTAARGAGIFSSGRLIVESTKISHNRSTQSGAGLHSEGDQAIAEITATSIIRNVAPVGAGIFNSNGALAIANTTIGANTTDTFGSVITSIADGAGKVVRAAITQSTIVDNRVGRGHSLRAESLNGAAGSVIQIANSIVGWEQFGETVAAVSALGGTGAAISSLGSNISNNDANGFLDQLSDIVNESSVVFGDLNSDQTSNAFVYQLNDSPSNPALDSADPSFNRRPGENGILDSDDETMAFDGRGSLFPRGFGGGIDRGAHELIDFDESDLIVNDTTDVTNLADDFVTLREAIFVANFQPGQQTITFSESIGLEVPSVIALTGGQLEVSDDVVINGPGKERLAVDGQGAGRLLWIHNRFHSDFDVALSSLTWTNGDAKNARGGAIEANGNLTISDSIVRNSKASVGGGVHATNELTINDSAIEGNQADSGAGIQAVHLTMQRSTVSGNTATSGGGGVSAYAAVTISDSTISNNNAARGAGVFGGEVTLNRSNVTNNNATYAGAILTGNLTLLDTTITGNSAAVVGGVASQGLTRIERSTITNNVADVRGGGLAFGRNTVATISDSTIRDNVGRVGDLASDLRVSALNDPDGVRAVLTVDGARTVLQLDGVEALSLLNTSAGTLDLGGGFHDDYFSLQSSETAFDSLALHGVNGIDELQLVNASIDFSDGGETDLADFDRIDLTNDGSESITLDAHAVGFVRSPNVLTVLSGKEDRVFFADAENWRMDAASNTADGFAIDMKTIIGDPRTVRSIAESPWQNIIQPSDVNNDGVVTSGDALRIINELGQNLFTDPTTQVLILPDTPSQWPRLYFDQNADGKATALDALRVINQLATVAPTVNAEAELAFLPAVEVWHASMPVAGAHPAVETAQEAAIVVSFASASNHSAKSVIVLPSHRHGSTRLTEAKWELASDLYVSSIIDELA